MLGVCVQRKLIKALHNHENTPFLTMRKPAVSEHIACFHHEDFESDWQERLVKETIAISRLKPNLNDKEGIHISAIYDPIPTKFALETRSFSTERDDVITF